MALLQVLEFCTIPATPRPHRSPEQEMSPPVLGTATHHPLIAVSAWHFWEQSPILQHCTHVGFTKQSKGFNRSPFQPLCMHFCIFSCLHTVCSLLTNKCIY